MSMDLCPENEMGRWLHVLGADWRYIEELLVNLGADTAKMRFANDGDPVDGATARDWAWRITDALEEGSLIEELVPDRSWSSGFRPKPRSDYPHRALWATNCSLRLQNPSPERLIWLHEVAEFFAVCGGFRQF